MKTIKFIWADPTTHLQDNAIDDAATVLEAEGFSVESFDESGAPRPKRPR